MRLWIDNETKVVLAKEAYHQDGSLAWRSRFDEIRFTTEIPSGVFSATIPQGFQEVEGRRFADMSDDLQRTLDEAGFKAVNPRYLPDGFRIIGAENSTFRGVKQSASYSIATASVRSRSSKTTPIRNPTSAASSRRRRISKATTRSTSRTVRRRC